MSTSKNNRILASIVVTLFLISAFIFLINLGTIIMIFVEIPDFADILLLRN